MDFNHIIKLSPQELYQKALEFKEIEDYDNLAIYLRMSANYGYELALNSINTSDDNYLLSRNQNHSKTIHFYEATKMYSYSANVLGWMYEKGIYFQKNIKKAKELYKYAISKDNGIAMFNLGLIYYYYSQNNEKTFDKGIKLFRDAASRGVIIATDYLVKIYSNKRIEPDFIKDKELFEKTVEMGNSNGINGLIEYYRKSKSNKSDVINYFLKNNKKEILKRIYGYDDYVIEIIINNNKLTQENSELKVHIMASPDGQLYFEAKNNWDANLPNKVKS